MDESIGNDHFHPFVHYVSLVFLYGLAGFGATLALLVLTLVWSGVLAW